MKPVRAIFLFRGEWAIAPGDIGGMLADCLKYDDIDGLTPVESESDGVQSFVSDGFRLTLRAVEAAMPVETFDRALDSLVSGAFRNDVATVLFEHKRHLEIELTPTPGEGVHLSPAAALQQLEAAHAVAAVVSSLVPPDAVYWAQSEQLMLFSQYQKVTAEATPLPLFVAGYAEGQAVRLKVPAMLGDRDIVIWRGAAHGNLAYATGLAFLRHLISTGHALPDGDAYGPVRGNEVEVRHVNLPTTDGRPAYHLNMKPMQEKTTGPDQVASAGALASIQARLRDLAGTGDRPVSRTLFTTAM